MAAEDDAPERTPLRTGEAAIMEALEETTDLEYMDLPLSEIIDDISAKHRVAIRLDRKALDEAGVTPDMIINFRARGVRLRSALKLMLSRPLELTWTIQNELIVITTKEKSDGTIVTKLYPVDDLIMPGRSGWTDRDSLRDIIVSSIAPQSWDEGNNDGIEFLPGVMVVPQTRDVHEQIQRVLDGIRAARKHEPAQVSENESTAKVWQALDRALELKSSGASLGVTLDSLAQQLQINICLDRRDLEEAGISWDCVFVADVPQLNLRDALDSVLPEMELEWVVECDSLCITTKERAAGVLEIKVYEISDLQESGRLLRDEGIAYLLQRSSPSDIQKSWDEVGGPGSIESLPGMIIVSQTRRVHEWIEQMLADLRALPAPEPVPPKPDNVVRRVYRIDGVAPERMAEIVTKLIEPESWVEAGGEGTIEAVAASRPGEEAVPAKPAPPAPPPAPAAPATSPLKTGGLPLCGALAQFGGGGMGGGGNMPLDPEQARRFPDGWLIVRQRESIQRQVQTLLHDFRTSTQSGVGYGGSGGGFF